MAYYAWTEIKAGDKSAKPGDVVTASGLGIDEDEFESLIEGGSVREEKFPADLPANVTPRAHMQAQAREAMEVASRPGTTTEVKKESGPSKS